MWPTGVTKYAYEGYRRSQRAREHALEIFDWLKAVGRRLGYCGVYRNRFRMEMTTACYNPVRLAKLTPMAARVVGPVCLEIRR